jgi:hypothetical protein
MVHIRRKPRVFIGSSSEDLAVANAIQARLDHAAEPIVWDQNIFHLSQYSLESLIKELDRSDFAIFVFAPNDIVKMRGKNRQVARDNVVFELGLFIGRLGRQRSFFVIPRGQSNFHLPTDLLGLTAATYNPNRSDESLDAAVSPACRQILTQMDEVGLLLKGIGDIGATQGGRLVEYYEDGRVPLDITVGLIEAAESEIIVIGSSFRSFVSHFEQQPDYKFKNYVIDLMQKKVNFKILVMDPDSKIVEAYAKDRNDPNLINHTRNSINILRSLTTEFQALTLPGKFEVYVYQRIPFSYILLVDQNEDTGRALLTHYLPATKKAHCPYIKLYKSSTPVAFGRYCNAIADIVKTSRMLFGTTQHRKVKSNR